MINIVLHEPEMPANTGNIGRTCVACGAVLHLIEPLGFRLNEKMIKRAASICFGAETDNADCLAKISRTIISESPEYKAILNKALAEGLSYPAARQTALLEYLPECKDIITGSNNILAIEYIKAILYNTGKTAILTIITIISKYKVFIIS